MSVVPINPAREVNPALVAALEELLEKAKAGDVWCGAFVCVEQNGDVWHNFVEGYPFSVIGGMEALKHVILQNAEAE